MLSFLTLLSWDPLVCLLFVCFLAQFVSVLYSQLLSFSILFVTARAGFSRAMHIYTPVGMVDLISMTI